MSCDYDQSNTYIIVLKNKVYFSNVLKNNINVLNCCVVNHSSRFRFGIRLPFGNPISFLKYKCRYEN